MSSKLVLITGGAGFIGQKLASALILQDIDTRIIDNFNPQIHTNDILPSGLAKNVDLIKGDIRDKSLMKRALDGVTHLVHLAAETGTGQSMYEIERYFSVNVQGTATLLDLIMNDHCAKELCSIVLASSRAVYGEGAYSCADHGVVFPNQRTKEQMSLGFFEPSCPLCSLNVGLLKTPESAPFGPTSMYGLTKQVQEQAILLFAKMKGINAFGLRYQNVYGPGQSLKNPYTGILAVFSNLARQNQDIEIYEDGLESRDFVYIDDVVEATLRSINYAGKFIGPLNVGSGQAISVIKVAEEISAFFESSSSIKVTGAFRSGDIRHNIADISSLSSVLGFAPKISFKEGLIHFLNWASDQTLGEKTAYLHSVDELVARRLMSRSL